LGGDLLRAAITQHAATELGIAEGMPVTLVFKAGAVHRLGETETVHDLED
jgi:molybdopterin-binding protein